MPVWIEEVIAETVPGVTQPSEAESLDQQRSETATEQQQLQTLALIRHRQERLQID